MRTSNPLFLLTTKNEKLSRLFFLYWQVIFLFLMCLFQESFAQDNNLDSQCKDCFEIRFTVDVMAKRPLFIVVIKRDEENISLLYKLLKKIDYDAVDKDLKIIKIRKEIDSLASIRAMDSLLTKLDTLELNYMKYRSFDSDSITIARCLFPEYDKMIDQLFSTSKQELENAEDGIVLDGATFHFEFNNKGTIKEVYAHSINSKRYPQLAPFVKETMGLYRNVKNDIFLNRKRTAGY